MVGGMGEPPTSLVQAPLARGGRGGRRRAGGSGGSEGSEGSEGSKQSRFLFPGLWPLAPGFWLLAPATCCPPAALPSTVHRPPATRLLALDKMHPAQFLSE